MLNATRTKDKTTFRTVWECLWLSNVDKLRELVASLIVGKSLKSVSHVFILKQVIVGGSEANHLYSDPEGQRFLLSNAISNINVCDLLWVYSH